MDRGEIENSDLLTGKIVEKLDDPNNIRNVAKEPPDGGFRAYSIVIGSFLTNGLLFGVINSFSVIYTVLNKQLHDENVPDAESKAAFVGSLALSMTFLLSPVSGVLTGLLGLRLTAVLGGTVATAGLVIASFVVHNVEALYLTYGVMYGIGASLAYTPSLAILGHYFKKYLGRVNGFVTIGSSIFTVIMSTVMKYTIDNYGLEWMFRMLAVISFGIALCGLLFKPIPVVVIEKPSQETNTIKTIMKTIVNVQIWKNRQYRLWAISMPVALFGYFVIYIHIGDFIQENFKSSTSNLPLQCMAATSGLGRLMFGILADRDGVDRILLQQISFYAIGSLTIILPFVKSFELLLVICLGIGMFDGGFISLIGPIAFEFCGSVYAAQAIGCMLGLSAVPVSIGPPVAGRLSKVYKSYTLPFVLAGLSPIVGATLMFIIRFRSRSRHVKEATNGHALPAPDVESTPSLRPNGVGQQTSL
ncbi:monocarboxylate transporter 10 [Pieris napi]|uniref:monocarboxylate transporter 10 n=1 Tax=Pieris napi TaxID=78633 RepID=UPI001FBAC6D2|nr:monocarboxylate transporter 10 [Pieris napi]